jgi:hypothetical protein
MTNFDNKSDAQLIALYGEVIAELLKRDIVHSGNNPIADMGERIVADYFGVEPAPPNQKSFDVITKDGAKIQVKALRQTKSGRRGLSRLADLNFNQLVAVLFANDMQLVEAVFIPVDAVEDHMGWSSTWKSHRLSITKKLLEDPRVRRIPASALTSQ